MYATYFVPQQNAPRLREKLEKMSRKAVKLGCAAIFVTLAKTFSRPHPRPARAAEGERVVYEALTVQGEPPRLNGWVFAATLEHEVGKDGQPVTLLRSHGEETLPHRFRTATPDNCDHCGTVRRRNSTYLVRHEQTGEWKQVGRSCLKDFLGLHQDPGALARYAAMLLTLEASLWREYEEEDDYEANGYYAYDLTEYLAHTVQAIEVEGWVSRSQAWESYENLMPTADLVWYVLTAKKAPGAANPFKLPKPTEASYQEVEAAREWVMAQDSSDNDYYHNLQMVVEMGVVTFKTAGYAASIVSSYRRAMERELRRAVLTATGNAHVGAVGKRQDMVLTLLGVNVFDGYYGTTHLHRFADSDGNLVVWWASNPRVVAEGAGHEAEFDGCCRMVPGATYKVKATVKDHGEYRGQRQTKVARVTVQPLTKPKKQRKQRVKKSA